MWLPIRGRSGTRPAITSEIFEGIFAGKKTRGIPAPRSKFPPNEDRARISLIINAVWPVLFLPAVLTVVHHGVITREERYLERKFGQEYKSYRSRVRHWL